MPDDRLLRETVDHHHDRRLVRDADELQRRASLLARLDVTCTDAERAVGVDLERDGDDDLAARRRAQPGELDLTEERVLREDVALALADADAHGRLHVAARGEATRALARDLRVARDDRVGVPAGRLDDEATRRDVDENGRSGSRCSAASPENRDSRVWSKLAPIALTSSGASGGAEL